MVIKLVDGGETLIDRLDHGKVSKHRWYRKRSAYTNYAMTVINKKWVMLHRFILGATPEMSVDHQNGDGLDNRRSNIRLCTKQENARAIRHRLNNYQSKYRGVFRQPNGTWSARIGLGTFKNEEDAAEAYNDAARLLFGEFHHLNRIKLCHIRNAPLDFSVSAKTHRVRPVRNALLPRHSLK